MKRLFAIGLLATTALATTAMTQTAQADTALFVGNSGYRALPYYKSAQLPRKLSNMLRGYQTRGFNDLDQAGFGQFLNQLSGAIDRGQPVIVSLSGYFAHIGNETYLLSVDMPEVPNPASVLRNTLPLSVVLNQLGRLPGRTLLLLGEEKYAVHDDRILTPSIGDLDIPQGVTVLIGSPADAINLASALASSGPNLPSDRLLQRHSMTGAGYLPRSLRVFSNAQTVEAPVKPEPAVSPDDALWDKVRKQDNLQGYNFYLQNFPRGKYATQARLALDKLRRDPMVMAQNAETALNLSRDQRRDIQRNLTLLGFSTRGVDGIFGSGSRRAISSWQKTNGLPQTSYLTANQISRIDQQAARERARQDEKARQKQLRAEQADRDFWAVTGQDGDARGLRSYLDRYPDGLFSDLARERLDFIAEKERAQAAVADRKAWRAAEQADTVASYQAYLRDHPKGRFANEARRAIDDLQGYRIDPAQVEQDKRAEKRLGLNQATAFLIENSLHNMGFNPGKRDGKFDETTREAIRQYQAESGLPVTGFLNQPAAVRLMAGDLFR